MSNRKYYVLCSNNCKFEGMTKEQILTAIEQAAATGEIKDVDSGFITTVKEQNSNAGLTFWIGTQAEYNAIENVQENCFYIISDDTTETDLQEFCERMEAELKGYCDANDANMQKFYDETSANLKAYFDANDAEMQEYRNTTTAEMEAYRNTTTAELTALTQEVEQKANAFTVVEDHSNLIVPSADSPLEAGAGTLFKNGQVVQFHYTAHIPTQMTIQGSLCTISGLAPITTMYAPATYTYPRSEGETVNAYIGVVEISPDGNGGAVVSLPPAFNTTSGGGSFIVDAMWITGE